MKLSRTVTYALKATLQLAQHGDGVPVPCSRLASDGSMPERFLLQILRNLVTHGILRSTRGVDGGYMLVRDPKEISVLDVIEAIDGPLTHEVALGEGLHKESRDKLSDAIENVTDTARRQLRSVRLNQLVPEKLVGTSCKPARKNGKVVANV